MLSRNKSIFKTWSFRLRQGASGVCHRIGVLGLTGWLRLGDWIFPEGKKR